ncbi:MAG: DUF1501 domain-containing protein [Isosphaeraceae bacterium]
MTASERQGHAGHGLPVSRRTFLVAGSLSLGAAAGARPTTAASATGAGRARSTILIWLSGGVSHIDTWDMKPDAPTEFRGEFRPVATKAPGVQLCEHLPLMAQQAQHVAVVRSLGHFGRGTGDHHAGYYYNLTGQPPDPSFRALLNDRTPRETDWPFLGSVVAWCRPQRPDLPSVVTLPQKPGAPRYTRPGQFSARLGIEYDPVYVLGTREKPTEFALPSLTLEGNVSVERLRSRRAMLESLDEAQRTLERSRVIDGYNRQQQRAFELIGSVAAKKAFDLEAEPLATRERYGATVNGMSFLLARRLVEAGVPFVSIFWLEDPQLDALCKSGGGWDTHGNNFGCLRDRLLPEFDRAYSALLDDLHQRGRLDETLVLVTSEMGRQPRIGDVRSGGVKGAGRDHWTNCMSVLLAGGGIQGGQTHGSSDRVAAYPAEHPVTPEDIACTVYHAMGVEPGVGHDREGRPFPVRPDGTPLTGLF